MLPAGLSMLWETVDARQALRDRFGFDSEHEAAAWCRSALAERWGIAAGDCARIVISDRNVIAWYASDGGSDGGLVVKWSADAGAFPRLGASTRLLHHLDARGVPVAAPIPSRDDDVRPRVSGPLGDLSVAVLPEVSGDWLDVADPVAVRDAGACLARIHGALRAIAWEAPTTARLDDPRSEVLRWLRSDDAAGPAGPRRRLERLLADAPDLRGTVQPVHNDFRAANVLTRASSVVAVLDFDEVIVAPPVFDLAKASVYLGTRFRDWGPTSPEVRARFRAGYESVRPLGDDEARWFELVVLWLGLRAGWPAAA